MMTFIFRSPYVIGENEGDRYHTTRIQGLLFRVKPQVGGTPKVRGLE
jgi:hypothetical protein